MSGVRCCPGWLCHASASTQIKPNNTLLENKLRREVPCSGEHRDFLCAHIAQPASQHRDRLPASNAQGQPGQSKPFRKRSECHGSASARINSKQHSIDEKNKLRSEAPQREHITEVVQIGPLRDTEQGTPGWCKCRKNTRQNPPKTAAKVPSKLQWTSTQSLMYR